MAVVLFLSLFGGRRLLKSKKKAPVFFSHVGMSMALAFAGAYAHYSYDSFLGLHLYHVGLLLLLVLGIGTRFFSFLSGLPSEFEMASKVHRMVFHAMGLALMGLLFLAGLRHSEAYFGLSFVSVLYMVFVWKFHRNADRPSPLKTGMRIVSVSIPLSFFLCGIWPEYYLAWLHILFIGGFAIITYAVATRVILAHGSYSTDLELNSSAFRWFLVFLGAGIVSRLFYAFTEGLWRTSWLHMAATAWVLAIGCWSYFFFNKIFKPGHLNQPSC